MRPQSLAMGMQNTATLFRPLNEIIESATLKITEEDTDEQVNTLYARLMQQAANNKGKPTGPKFIHPAELDSAISLSRHGSLLESTPDIAKINRTIGAYADGKKQAMYPPNPEVERIDDDDEDEDSNLEEPLSPES